MDIAGALIGGAAQFLTAGLNNEMAAARAREDRAENYKYGEMAAENADRRTRALYKDYYSPEALLRQYNEAGLSPSMMYGGTPGQGGMSGAQGTGAHGIQTPYMPMSMVEAAQAAQLLAQTEKTKAETKNINKDTVLKSLEADYNTWRNYMKEQSFNLTTFEPYDEDGNPISFFTMAENAKNLDSFIDRAVKLINNDEVKAYAKTENGMKELRGIYMAANMFDRDIKVLSEEGVNADFQKSIMTEMQKKDFAEQNATTAVKQLQAAAETADLTKEQKAAWNNLLERIGKKSETAKDVLIIISMLINNAATNWKLPK